MPRVQNVQMFAFPLPDPYSLLDIDKQRAKIFAMQEASLLQQAFQLQLIASEEFVVFSHGRAKQCWGLSWECF